MSSKDGGPAFPSQMMDRNGIPYAQGVFGMSLRDYFAGQALVGVMAQGSGLRREGNGTATILSDEIARASYRLADAMLAARESEGWATDD